MPKQRHFYQFGPFRLEPEERVLLRNGKRLTLTGKAFDVLVLLVKNHGSLVRRDQIIIQVWPDTHVGEGNLNVHLTTIRKMLGENYIEGVPKQGYRFNAEVTEQFEDSPENGAPLVKRKITSAWIGLAVLVSVILVYVAVDLRTRGGPQRGNPGAALYDRALEYERVGDDEQALTTLDQALSVDPAYHEACVRAAYISYELNQTTKAGEYLARCQAASEARSEPLRLKAKALVQIIADNTTGAMELYQLIIDKYPRDVDALYRFAWLATYLDRVDDADNALRACVIIEPQSPYCRFQSMYVRIKQNRFQDALADYNSLPASVREYAWFDEPVGIALMGNGQLQEAAVTFERLTRRQERLHGTAHFTAGKEWLADILLYEGRMKEGTRRIQQVIRSSDDLSDRGGNLAYLAQTYALLENTREAKKFAAEAVTTSTDTGILTRAAVVLASVGDIRGAEQLLKRLQATHIKVAPATDHLIRGLLALAKGDTEGIEEIRLAHEVAPRDQDAAYWLGIAYFRAGDYKSGLGMFQKMLDMKGTILLDGVSLLLPVATYRIAECYDRLGDSNAAKPYYAAVARSWAAADDDVKPKRLGLYLKPG